MSHRGPTAAIALVVACGPGTSDTVTTVMQQVTLQVSGHGTVQLSTGHQCKDQCVVSLGNGARVSATASADDGWTFSGWSGSCSGSSSCQFTVDHDLELDASFGLKPTIPSQHVLTAARNGAGSIRSSPAGIDCGATCSAGFGDGTRVTLTATADSGWRFDSWSGGCGGPGDCVVQLAADTAVWATFVKLPPPQHVLAVALAGDGAGKVVSTPAGIDCGRTCSWLFTEGTTVKLAVQPASGSTFAGWGGACSGTADCSLKVSADASVTATFNAPPPPPDECAGLAPPAPGSPTLYRQKPLSSTAEVLCERGAVDGSGNLALWSTQKFQGFKSDIVFLDALGTVRSSGTGVAMELMAQLTGFAGIDVFPQGGYGFDTVVFAADGAKSASAPGGGHFPILAEDAIGGMVIATDAPAIDAYDATGKRRWHTQIAHAGVAVGVDRAGNVLTLFESGTLHGQWVDGSGKAGASFDLGSGFAQSDAFELYPRVGSGLFVLRVAGGHTTWLHQLDTLATVAAAAPAYLQSRPDTRLHMAHGGKAYAMLPVPAQGQCTQRIEVLAPSGKSCGSAEFAVASGSCTTNFIDVGYDGTVVQQLPAAMEDHSCAGANCSCTWRWWPGFFR